MVAFKLADARAQTQLRHEPFHEWMFPDGVPWTQFHRTESGYLLRFPDLADFLVSADGCEVHCHPVPGSTHETLVHLYEHQVLPLALSRLGKLVLHASAVEVNGGGIVFVGESGRGKSTLAASFATNGCRLLTDDGLVIEETEKGYQALPSQPSIRLWDDSQEALIHPATPMAPPVQHTSKARFLAGGDFAYCGEPRPLHRVYFLGGGKSAEIAIERLEALDVMIELVKHSFLLDIHAHDLIASHFDQLSRLAAQRIYYRLDYPRRFDLLPLVRNAVGRHCRE
jgi:hypothetical protein